MYNYYISTGGVIVPLIEMLHEQAFKGFKIILKGPCSRNVHFIRPGWNLSLIEVQVFEWTPVHLAKRLRPLWCSLASSVPCSLSSPLQEDTVLFLGCSAVCCSSPSHTNPSPWRLRGWENPALLHSLQGVKCCHAAELWLQGLIL